MSQHPAQVGDRIGVDGGGTRSRLLWTDESGRELLRLEGAPAGIDAMRPPDEVARVVVGLVQEAARQLERRLPVAALWCGLAGAGRSEPQAAVRAALSDAQLARRVGVGSDVEAAFEAAFGSACGSAFELLLIAGTGSVALARDAFGSVVRVGGWGARFGDEGSALELGRAAVTAVLQHLDGRLALRPSFADAVLEHFGVTQPADLAVAAERAAKARLAALAPHVTAAARHQDSTARVMCEQAVSALVQHVHAVMHRFHAVPSQVTVALGGGLLEVGAPLRDPLCRQLEQIGCALHEAPIDAARGAVHCAERLLTTGHDPEPGGTRQERP